MWSEESHRAFRGMKQALLSAADMQLVDPDRGFVVRTDASNFHGSQKVGRAHSPASRHGLHGA